MNLKMTILLLIITSCSSLTKEDCNNTNWAQKGQVDGSSGKSSTLFSKYHEQCQEHGISISKAKYLQGHTNGLNKYCNYKSGYQYGLEGEDPFSDCDKISPSFNKGYEEGFRQFQFVARKKKIDEQKDLDRKKGIESILASYNSKKCRHNSDCQKEGDCSFNKCRHDNSKCTFNSDCKIEGNCSNESTYVSSVNEWVSVNVCKY